MHSNLPRDCRELPSPTESSESVVSPTWSTSAADLCRLLEIDSSSKPFQTLASCRAYTSISICFLWVFGSLVLPPPSELWLWTIVASVYGDNPNEPTFFRWKWWQVRRRLHVLILPQQPYSCYLFKGRILFLTIFDCLCRNVGSERTSPLKIPKKDTSQLLERLLRGSGMNSLPRWPHRFV